MAKLSPERLAALAALVRFHGPQDWLGDWTARAACREPGAASMIVYCRAQARAAKAVCDRCSVVGQCLSAGLTQPYGVWGGLLANERVQLRTYMRHDGKPVPVTMTRQPKPVQHGTAAGYQRCRVVDGRPCPACREANRVNQGARRRARRAAAAVA
jgi:hypothetical protein